MPIVTATPNVGSITAAPAPSGDTSGATDQAALTALDVANKVLLLQTGTYWVTGVTFSNLAELVILPGTTVKLASGSNTTVVTLAGANSSLLGGGTIDGNRANQSAQCDGVDIAADGVTVEGMTVQHCYYFGICAVDVSHVRVRNNYVTDTGNIGIFAEAKTTNVSDVEFSCNYVDRSAEPAATIAEGGIKAHGVAATWAITDIRIVDNRVYLPTNPTASTPVCIETWGDAARATITGNLTSGGATGVSLDTTTQGTVAGNACYNAKTYGIELASSSYCTVTGNTVDGNSLTTKGIVTSNTTPVHNTISSNSITGCTNRAIQINSGSNYTVVVGNNILHTVGYAVELLGSLYFSVTGNILDGTGGATKAIVLDTSYRGSVAGNTMWTFTQHGILITATTAVTLDLIDITGNTFVTVGTPVGSSLSGGATLGVRVRAVGNTGMSTNYDIDILDLKDNVQDVTGAGTPESAVAAGIGSTFHRTDGGASTSLYVKESGTGNTGWVGK